MPSISVNSYDYNNMIKMNDTNDMHKTNSASYGAW